MLVDKQLQKIKKISITMAILMLLFSFIFTVKPVLSNGLLTITVSIGEEIYGVGEIINVTGNVYYGTPLSTLVGIEVTDAQGHILTVRTVISGATVEDSWQVYISDVIPCDQWGNPKTSFNKGELAYFKVNVRNDLEVNVQATLSLNIYFADGTSFSAGPIYEGPISPGSEWIIVSVGIPSEAPTGLGLAFASLLTDMPKNNGYPLCPEKKANFTILGSGSPSKYMETTPPTENGKFELLFKAPKIDSFLGTYTVYASVGYRDEQASANANFDLILRGDVNFDGKVDMKDIILVIGKFGTGSSNPEWDPTYDLNFDGKVDMKDIVIVVSNFSNTAYYPS